MPRVFLLVPLVACSNRVADVDIDITHDVCSPISISSASTVESQLTAIADAFTLWREHGIETLETAAQGAIEIRFESAALNFFGLYDDEHSVIYINDRITDPSALSVVIAHELGHAFGLPHIMGRPSLMNPGNTMVLPTPDDDAAVEALWGPCPAR